MMMTDQQRKNLGRGRNRKGRPKGSRNKKKVLKELASMELPFTVDGKTQQLPISEIVIRLLISRAENGDHRSISLCEKLETHLQPHVENENTGFLVVPGMMEEGEWVKLMMEKNKKSKRPDTAVKLVKEYDKG